MHWWSKRDWGGKADQGLQGFQGFRSAFPFAARNLPFESGHFGTVASGYNEPIMAAPVQGPQYA
jgi:hypothetical protein